MKIYSISLFQLNDSTNVSRKFNKTCNKFIISQNIISLKIYLSLATNFLFPYCTFLKTDQMIYSIYQSGRKYIRQPIH